MPVEPLDPGSFVFPPVGVSHIEEFSPHMELYAHSAGCARPGQRKEFVRSQSGPEADGTGNFADIWSMIHGVGGSGV